MFSNKYKDRDPIETIKIIKEFFLEKNFLLIKSLEIENDIGVFSCQYKLFYNNNILILTTNGKGLSKILSEASCLSEMYERFCNLHFLNSRNIIFHDLYKKQLKINEYKYFKLDNLQKTISIKDIDKMSQYYTSNGMAAGNTLEEALNQGISEIFERHLLFSFYQGKIEKYYILNNNNIKNKQLKNILNNIENKNNKIILIDFSYNYNLPVIGCICIDLLTNGIKCNFGCFLDFNIALERCFTEIYQNVKNGDRIEQNLIPPPTNFYNLRFKDKGNIGMCGSLPSNFKSENFIFVDNFNNKIFIDDIDNYNNFDILKRNQEIAKLNNFIFYYRDVSLIEKMSSVHIISNKSNIGLGTLSYFKTLPSNEKENLKYLETLNNSILKDIIINNFTSKQFIKKYYLFFHLFYNKKNDPNFFPSTQFFDQSNLFSRIHIYPIIANLLIDNNISIESINKTSFSIFYNNFKLLDSIILYKENERKYSDEEILKIFNELGINVSLKFIQNCTNIEYIIEECYLKPIRENYLILQNFIETLKPSSVSLDF